jgi:hypothetical protein
MQYYKLELTSERVKVTLRKKPRENIVLATIDRVPVEISIAEKKIEVISGEVPAEIWEVFKKVIIQYFL